MSFRDSIDSSFYFETSLGLLCPALPARAGNFQFKDLFAYLAKDSPLHLLKFKCDVLSVILRMANDRT